MNNNNNENRGICNTDTVVMKSKISTYLLLTFLFIVTSFLSLLFIYHILCDKSSFLSLKFLTNEVVISLIILLIIYFLLDTLRFYYILKTLGIFVSFTYMIKLAFINIFVSNITPFATGGGFAQVFLLNKKGVSLGDATAASTIRTVLPVIFFVISTPIVLINYTNFFQLFQKDNIYTYILGIVMGYSIIAYLFYKLINDTRIIKVFIFRVLLLLEKKRILSTIRTIKIRRKLLREIDCFSSSFYRFFNGNKIDIIISILFTILFLLSLFIFPVILIIGLGYNISPFSIIALQIVITFITYFAPTPGATGIAEGGFSLIFSSIIDKSDLLSLTFTWRFFSIYIGVFIGLIIFYFEIIRINFNKKR
ncbi:MAG: lysylphosphatidylglycerol synthase transmembrane domain-containing protein [Eubacteriaceae bacterium]